MEGGDDEDAAEANISEQAAEGVVVGLHPELLPRQHRVETDDRQRASALLVYLLLPRVSSREVRHAALEHELLLCELLLLRPKLRCDSAAEHLVVVSGDEAAASGGRPI